MEQGLAINKDWLTAGGNDIAGVKIYSSQPVYKT